MCERRNEVIKEKSIEERESALLTRKSFLQTLGGVAALTQASQFPAAAAVQKPKVKLGASLYSYNGDLQLGNMDFEDCLIDLADMGAEGVEFLPDALVPDYPNPPKQFVDQWFRWLKKYNLTPTGFDCAADAKMHKTRALSAQEIADMIVRDLKLANQLGFKIYRDLGNSWSAVLGPKGSVWDSGVTCFQIYDKILPFAEKYDVKIGEELHIPFVFKSEWFEQIMEYIRKTKTKHLGFVPDMSIFMSKPMPGFDKEAWIQRGLRKDVVDYIFSAAEEGVTEEKAKEEVGKMSGGKAAEDAVGMIYHMVVPRDRRNKPEDLAKIMPYIFHIHAKFYNILEDLSDEASIPYSQIIPVLARGGYSNYLSSEYEGDRSPLVASHQIRRQHLMIRRMWDAA
jgi:sugar phosphate isomerase/epimerase